MKGVPIIFGYKMIGGKLQIDEIEAEVIREIFESYINGESLKQIAEKLNQDGVVYRDGSKCWNKNRICRIIENEKYCGNGIYPFIISKDIFEKANSIKDNKASVKIEVSPMIEAFIESVFCTNCKAHYRHDVKRRKNIARWICRNGCQCSRRIPDKVLFNAILQIANRLIANNNLARIKEYKAYQPDEEVAQLSEEINIMLHTRSAAKIKEMQFQEVKKKILQCASKKYDCCTVDQSGTVTDEVISKLKMMKPMKDTEELIHIKDIISKIWIDTTGTIAIELVNGKIIKE